MKLITNFICKQNFNIKTIKLFEKYFNHSTKSDDFVYFLVFIFFIF